MTNNSLIVGFEGPCLSGKTTIINKLLQKFTQYGFLVLRLPEYTELAGGYKNFPTLKPKNKKESIESASFFINLEQIRINKLNRWIQDNATHDKKKLILIDRLLLSCLAIRKIGDDIIGYQHIYEAIKQGKAIIPDIIEFIELPKSTKEMKKRMSQRKQFEHSEILYFRGQEYYIFFKYLEKKQFINNIKFVNENKLFSIEKEIFKALNEI